MAIVTGASRGIGKAIAKALAREGASVVIAARTESVGGRMPGTIYETVQQIEAAGGKALAVKTDISKEEDVAEMVRRTLQEFGRIDILMNNAGINKPALILDMPIKDWDLIMRVNLRGCYLCTRAVLPTMIKQASGCIVNTSSFVARKIPDILTGLAYDASKAAIERFTWGLANEVKGHGIWVNAIEPGYVETEGSHVLSPDEDKTGWQKPEMWGEYIVFLATRPPDVYNGRIFLAEDLKKECAKAGWRI